MSASLQDKVTLITGASSGIGEALAREFHRRGAKLVLAARRLDRLQTLSQELGSTDGRTICVTADVTKEGDLERVVADTIRKFGRLDIVVANAGFGVVGRIERLTVEDYHRQFDTNVYGVIRTVRAALPELKRSKGRLGIVGSVNGFLALPGNTPYAMSKYAVRALAEGLRPELAAEGISVTHIAPGFVESEIRQVDNKGNLHGAAKDPVPAWLRMPAKTAARQITSAIASRRRELIVTAHGKVIVFFFRHFPRTMAALVKQFVNSGRREPGTKRAEAT